VADKTLDCYEIDLRTPLRCTMAGIRAPLEPFPQSKRVMPDYIAFMVVKGEIFLTDFVPHPEPVRVRAGEIHIVAPELAQSSTVPFAPGIQFLWFHFYIPGAARLRTRKQTHQIVNRLYKPGDVSPQQRWLLPRHLVLHEHLDAMIRMHAELLENMKLWGRDDAGTHLICAHMVYLLHREFVQQTLRERAPGRVSPEVAHVSRAQNFIRLNYDKPISLAEVADNVQLNAAYLSRCFRKVTGRTVVDFILRTRIDAAKSLLAEQPHAVPVKEVAYLTGFASAAYFCRIFRRLEKQTALQYAARMQPEF
jgi:AraC-like DNA-binding protein